MNSVYRYKKRHSEKYPDVENKSNITDTDYIINKTL